MKTDRGRANNLYQKSNGGSQILFTADQGFERERVGAKHCENCVARRIVLGRGKAENLLLGYSYRETEVLNGWGIAEKRKREPGRGVIMHEGRKRGGGQKDKGGKG